jgi:hypothetical protein
LLSDLWICLFLQIPIHISLSVCFMSDFFHRVASRLLEKKGCCWCLCQRRW